VVASRRGSITTSRRVPSRLGPLDRAVVSHGPTSSTTSLREGCDSASMPCMGQPRSNERDSPSPEPLRRSATGGLHRAAMGPVTAIAPAILDGDLTSLLAGDRQTTSCRSTSTAETMRITRGRPARASPSYSPLASSRALPYAAVGLRRADWATRHAFNATPRETPACGRCGGRISCVGLRRAG